ncbi:cyclic peptide export ABC transporter [Flavobacterium jejuense]|uniref:Cyclic peptide export ABC transporter n=1 Tax=Flavobacterium jejuense TaxID=1544455 RepID=A0ABX0IQD8_9FLAO|nr:cyclic peptide export ABC transporter [Flavobacterium jejuense]NHN25913.1 cyclic peptide export ABC transporter [Flavobacterium jejuense]
MKRFSNYIFLVFIFSVLITNNYCYSQQQKNQFLTDSIDKEVIKLMKDGDIPGLSLIVLKDGKQVIKSFGYANLENKELITPSSLFELASCSKAFTALAVQNLIQEKKITLDSDVTDYLPWFYVSYKEKPAKITIRQLLHHTTGIPWQTISTIPASNSKTALEMTVKNVVGTSLNEMPGKQFEYATINYDILALIIEKVSGISFEDYLRENVFDKLNLKQTFIGTQIDRAQMTTGYKISFLEARPYSAPIFKGNNAAGYVISDALDIAKWLNVQLGLSKSQMYPLVKTTQLRDETVPPHGNSSYGMGWEVSLSGNGEIMHTGLNPNFTSFISLKPNQKIGVAVLANSNSSYTNVIGDKIMRLLSGENIRKEYNPGDGNDKLYSIISVIMCCYIFLVFFHLTTLVIQIRNKNRYFERISYSKMINILTSFIFLGVVLLGIYLLPIAMGGFTWKAATVWTPNSFIILITLITVASGLSYLAYLVSYLFPGDTPFLQKLPKIVLVSIFSGLSNMAVVLLITSTFNNTVELKYLSFYYLLTLMIYILGRKYVQTTLIHFTRDVIYEKRLKLIERIFSTSFQKFEKIDRGRVYSTLNDDVSTVGDSANMIVGFVTSFITVGGAFIYLASTKFWATLLIVIVIVGVSALYFAVSKRAEAYFEGARDTQNVFMRLLNGLIDGFKEISLQHKKKIEFKDDIADTAEEYRVKTTIAHVKFVNAFLIGESTFIILLGLIAFGIPKIFPDLENTTIMSFVVVLLYLNGPLNSILSSIPAIIQVKIAWNRIQSFIAEIPANLDLNKIPETLDKDLIENIKFENVSFTYKFSESKEQFSIGPINLEVDRGQILFIIGGNGSGKTTLAKLITGLYEPDNGNIFINENEVDSSQLGEYFSAVFSPCHLFHKLYNINMEDKSDEVNKYLKILGLDKKVEIIDNSFNTISLSGGQRKRLALLQCYLEDSPIYLFDEWAADQDPEYRRFFYRELLPEMKRRGKIIIAITHDDHYFDVADKILKMNMGKVEYVSNDFKVDEVLIS